MHGETARSCGLNLSLHASGRAGFGIRIPEFMPSLRPVPRGQALRSGRGSPSGRTPSVIGPAFETGGHTICILPGGLDRPFPPENGGLWKQLLEYPGAVMVSEFAFGTGASKLTLRRRNKLIVACSRAVFVSQSALNGGAMNAYRFAREQGKPVATCATDGREDTAGNAMIREELRQDDAWFTTGTSEQEFLGWLRGSYSLI